MSIYNSVNPYTEEMFGSFNEITSEQIDSALTEATLARSAWSKLPFRSRAEIMLKVSELLKNRLDELALLASLEMGKLFSEAKAEIIKCAGCCEYYANHAAQFLLPEEVKSEGGRTSTIYYRPMGVILGVFPWNFPYWQIIRSAVPAMMAGNVVLVKPAPSVPQCALALQKIFNDAEFPEGVIQTIFATNEQIEQIIGDSRVHAVTLTGSERAGSIVASNAAKHIKKSVLELGGSDPFIVFDDVDIEKTVEQAMFARFQNNGQSCIAAKRFILHQNISEKFTNMLVHAIRKMKLGNPLEESVNIGPLARRDLKDQLSNQVSEAIAEGSKCIFSMDEIPAKGFFYPLTVLTQIPVHAKVNSLELFGPVVSIYEFSEPEEALKIANNSPFGLASSVWTTNQSLALSIAQRLECGNVSINAVFRSDPRFSFGGIKKSGFGRELGMHGIREFSYIKTVHS